MDRDIKICLRVWVLVEKRTRACICTVLYIWDWQQLTLKWVGTGEWQKTFLCLSGLLHASVCCSQRHIVLESCFVAVQLRVVYLNIFITFQKQAIWQSLLTFLINRQGALRWDNRRSVNWFTNSLVLLHAATSHRNLLVFTSCSRFTVKLFKGNWWEPFAVETGCVISWTISVTNNIKQEPN